MSFCTSCGAPVDGRFCSKCGGSAGVPVNGPGAAAPPPADIGAGLTENVAGALCYLGGLVTGIIFLVIPPYNTNPRIKFHALQSILFNLAWVVAWMILIPMQMVLPSVLSLLLSLFSLAIWFGGFVIWLLLMWKAYQRQSFSLPIIGDIARQQAGQV